MDQQGVGPKAAECVEAIEFRRGFIILTFGGVHDPRPGGRRCAVGLGYRLLAVDVERVGPPIVAYNGDGKAGIHQEWVEGVVVGDRGDAAQQILNAAEEQSLITSRGGAGGKLRVGPAPPVDFRNPIAGVLIKLRCFVVGQTVELQVIVCVDEPRQQPIAPQINDRIRGRRFHIESRDARSADTQTADTAAAKLSVDKRDVHLCIRSTSTMGRPCHFR
jgi:hypothetical protein